MANYLLVAIGGALGSVARVWAISVVSSRFGTAFPWGTLVVNTVGSFIIGVAAGLSFEGRTAISSSTRIFLMAGICGGFTTFSAFSLQTLELLQQKQWLAASANALLSFALCLVAVWLGYILADRMR
jgi:fluoride exporter